MKVLLNMPFTATLAYNSLFLTCTNIFVKGIIVLLRYNVIKTNFKKDRPVYCDNEENISLYSWWSLLAYNPDS